MQKFSENVGNLYKQIIQINYHNGLKNYSFDLFKITCAYQN